MPSPSPDSSRPILSTGALLAALTLASFDARSEPESAVPSCYATGGGSLEICRSAGEPEGVFFVAPPCRLASDVQILRLRGRAPPGPLQVVHDAEPRPEAGEPREARRRRGAARRDEPAEAADPCATERGGESARPGHALRSGRQAESLATAMPQTAFRFWSQDTSAEPSRRTGRRGRRKEPREQQPPTAGADLSLSPMTIAGRDWAGDDYFFVFMVAVQNTADGLRPVLIQGRTYDFESLDIRVRAEGSWTSGWAAFGQTRDEEPGRRRGRSRREREAASLPAAAAVLDEWGKPVASNCPVLDEEKRALSGSISVVDRTYHYFYTDILPSDCNEPPAKRRVGLYLRTSRDLADERVWSAPTTIVESLPADTIVRVAKARAMERWAVAYSCFRPANAPGGPVADICLQYTKDLSAASVGALTFFSAPASAVRSDAYLGLRSGGDASGRYGREGFAFMTDRYGVLDAPAIHPGKGGLLTWTDSRALGGAGPFGNPVYWSTWAVQPR